MTEEENKKIDSILSEISDRVLGNNWEAIEELFELVPEYASKEQLARKYLWRARYFLDRHNDTKKSIYYLNLITKTLSESRYYTAQLWLGRIYSKFNTQEAIKHWETVSEIQSSAYYNAQFDLARMYIRQDNYLLAIAHFLNAQKHVIDSNKNQIYLWLAVAYRLNNQAVDAVSCLEKFVPENSKDYAEILMQQYLLNINNKDYSSKLTSISAVDGWAYNWAQAVLASEAWELGQKNKAISYWLNIQDDSVEYINAQISLYKLGIKHYLESNAYTELKKLLLKITLPQYAYDVNILLEIVQLGLRKTITKKIFELYQIVKEIKQELQIKKTVITDKDFDILHYCSKFAHYTSCTVAKSILGDQGSLQLSVADLMNDPTEGKILHNILGQPDWLTHRFNHRYYQAYASCFSFNHDSLNQFRLYGKESGKEATGASMVFDLHMFSDEEYSANISAIHPTARVNVNDSSLDSSNDENSFQVEVEKKAQITKLPLYRCVYFDPKSSYYKLASRAEMTFYRQGHIDGKSEKLIKEDWEKYSKIISDKEELLKKMFGILTKNIQDVESLMEQTTGKNILKYIIINLINNILLPIQFLIKHAAYIEEDECRMLYITNAGSDVIKEQNGRLYIEYEPSVVEYLDKIYLSDGAKEERAFLERAWQQALDRDGITDKSIDIRDSDNPFRI